MIADTVAGTIDVSYSNIGEEWNASLESDTVTLASARGATRAEALRNLADELESV